MFIGMIPARIGSARLPRKNLALLDEKPLISYAIQAARDSGVFDQIVLNADHDIFSEIADRYDIEFYLRPTELGSSEAKVDQVVYDFLIKHPCDNMAWVNPASPLQTGDEVKDAIHFFTNNNYDSLVTVLDTKVHCVYKETPLNFNQEELFGQTQDIEPFRSFVYSVCAWKTNTFIQVYERDGFGFFCGSTGYYPVSKETAILIKTEDDLRIAEYFIKARFDNNKYSVLYDPLIKKLT